MWDAKLKKKNSNILLRFCFAVLANIVSVNYNNIQQWLCYWNVSFAVTVLHVALIFTFMTNDKNGCNKNCIIHIIGGTHTISLSYTLANPPDFFLICSNLLWCSHAQLSGNDYRRLVLHKKWKRRRDKMQMWLSLLTLLQHWSQIFMLLCVMCAGLCLRGLGNQLVCRVCVFLWISFKLCWSEAKSHCECFTEVRVISVKCEGIVSLSSTKAHVLVSFQTSYQQNDYNV